MQNRRRVTFFAPQREGAQSAATNLFAKPSIR
jgi:hypothetical protein